MRRWGVRLAGPWGGYRAGDMQAGRPRGSCCCAHQERGASGPGRLDQGLAGAEWPQGCHARWRRAPCAGGVPGECAAAGPPAPPPGGRGSPRPTPALTQLFSLPSAKKNLCLCLSVLLSPLCPTALWPCSATPTPLFGCQKSRKVPVSPLVLLICPLPPPSTHYLH